MRAALAVFKAWMTILRRYPGWLFMDLLWPFVSVAFPVVIGTAVAGSYEKAVQNFHQRLPGVDPLAFFILGAATMSVISEALWRFGTFIRWQQRVGTLESLLLTPADTTSILAGISLYSMTRAMITFFGFITISDLVLHLGLLGPRLLPGIVLIFLGVVPVFGMSMMLGVFVLWFREVGNVVSIVEWGLYTISGVLYPVWFFPRAIRVISALLPSTWMVGDVRAVVLGTQYLLGNPVYDLMVLGLMIPAWLLTGRATFGFVLGRLKKGEGVSRF